MLQCIVTSCVVGLEGPVKTKLLCGCTCSLQEQQTVRHAQDLTQIASYEFDTVRCSVHS